MWEIFVLGLAVGFGAAAFPGPINLEVVRRSVSQGTRGGVAFGLGAVSADLIYVTGTSLGAAALVAALPGWSKPVMYLLGAALLFGLGITALRAKVALEDPPPISPRVSPKVKQRLEKTQDTGLIHGYLLGFVLTFTSPSTLAYWAFVSVSATGHALQQGGSITLPLVIGVGTACTIWVFFAATIAGLFHRKISPKAYIYIERAAGIALCTFAAVSAYKGIELLTKLF